MPLLDIPRCPQCKSEVDLKALWLAAPKTGRGTRMAGHIGIICPVCGIKLRVLQSRVQITSIALFVLLLSTAFGLGRLLHARGDDIPMLIGLGTVYLAGYLLFQKSIPRLLQLRFFEEGEQAGFPLVTLAEDLAEERKAIEEDDLNQEPPADDGPAWTCESCGAENPGNFNECWKCMKLRPEAGASNSS
jgi:hypothetical protein